MLNPYLNFDGNCEEAFKHYEKVLGAKVQALFRNADAPPEMPYPPERKDKIMHGSITIDGQVLMASDVPPEYFQKPQGFAVSLTVKDPVEAAQKFASLVEGGSVTMPFGKTFWSKGFGMGFDRFGIPWMINCPAEGY
ncbi:VOC family protein [Bradyrhizobium sp. SZCCHNPS2010]|uniref:VOC family protein n=1 Tax=Bradyrhizobium sp. SZCCHNPS2010 TaxID=3057333 RepID=UPI0029166659|nr:VOC family protein [Bradyrhizobium sp. SZCCHNPS2010]